MKIPPKQMAMKQIAERLAELLDAGPDNTQLSSSLQDCGADGVVEVGLLTFVVGWKNSGALASVTRAIEQLRGLARQIDAKAIPLVAVPFMGEAARERCARTGIAWIDLSGNARVDAPGLRVLVEGKPNRYKPRGRPCNVFAPKGSRLTRWLLIHPTRWLSQREISRETNLDEGYTSRIASRLEDEGLIVRNKKGAIKARDPDLLLDAWREAYDFSRHEWIRGHVAARTGDMLLTQLAGVLAEMSVPCAATGLAAAWLLDRYAGFRIVTMYLEQEPTPAVLEALSFREDARGANVWLLVPADSGVSHGASLHKGVRCVHPVQIYLDLLAHPERAAEAAQRLRAEHLNWNADD